MGDKLKKIYDVLVEGAENSLTGKALYQYVIENCSKATSKKIVKASLLALTDPDMKDEKLLRVIYDLAITHRLDPATHDDAEPEQENSADDIGGDADKPRKKARSSKSAVEATGAVA